MILETQQCVLSTHLRTNAKKLVSEALKFTRLKFHSDVLEATIDR